MQGSMTTRDIEHLLVKIIVIAAIVALAIWKVSAAANAGNQADAVGHCYQNAPMGWNCQVHPTGYPGS